tara:strand:+ start:714 stop:1001 length:288 start_codon:yes stop_codon:yes gene_type:complete
MTKLNVDVDGDKKPDFQVDFKTLILAGGIIFSGASSYFMLQSEIEIAKTLPKQIISQDDTRVVNQKLDFLIKEFEKFEVKTDKRIEDLERNVYKK